MPCPHRPMSVCLSLAAAAALVLPACGPTETPDVTWHRDVQPLIASRCASCHTAGQIGPMPLDTYESASTYKDLIVAVTASGEMPPWKASAGCTDYRGDPSLSDEEKATFARWAELDAPEGDLADVPGPEVNQPVAPAEFLPDLVLEMPSAYTPMDDVPDDYHCFVMEWPEPVGKYVTGFSTRPGNPAIVHHVIGYLIPPERAAEIRALDEAEAGEGYTCYGGPGSNRTQWLGAWAPGGANGAYPAGTGLYVEPGSLVVMQVHYHPGNGTGSDQTAVEVTLADEVERQALVLPFTNPLWVNGDNMLIPAGEPDVTHTWTVAVSELQDDPQPFLVHSANLHMHTLGRAGSLWIDRADGSRECMLDIGDWDFDWQLSYGFVEPKVIEPGDSLGIECRWDNSGARSDHHEGDAVPPHDVTWGDGTEDEMCLGVFYVSEM